MKSKQKKDTFPARRKFYFYLLTFLIPILFFLFLEIGLRIFHYGGNLDLFISAPGEYSKYYMCNPNVGHRYFFMQSTVPDPPNDIFLKKKPQNGYRIFVLGGSTTAGYPYGNNVMFSRILYKILSDIFPQKTIEVINTAMSAVNSYTLLDFMDEILQKKPDALLIYAGHNEFYGALGAGSYESLGKFRWFVKIYLKLQRFKTFLLIRNIIGWLKKGLDKLFFGGTVSNPSATLMERMVAKQTIPLGSPIYQLGKHQFEGNLRDILTKAKKAGIPVILSELVCNVRDQKPFISVSTDTLPPAKKVYKQAKILEQEGKYEKAKRAYYRAKDLDALRFRATEEFNQIIHRLGEEFHVPVVPMKHYFEAASPHGLVGDNLMLDHLHPNLDGYFLMAEGFLDAMRKNGLIAAKWDSTRIQPMTYYKQTWGFTELDKAFSEVRIRILKGNWPFKPKNLPNRALIEYRPTTPAESLAVKIWVEADYNLERAHVQLAEYYEKQGKLLKAYQEYNALICATPFNVSPYLRASNLLIKMHKFKQALPLLLHSLDLEESAYAYKWIGQIYLNYGQVKESIPYLEKAKKLSPKDPQLLYNLSGAYALNGQYKEARLTLKILNQVYPDFPGARDLQRQLARIH